MPQDWLKPWLKPWDVEKLATRSASFEGDVPVAELAGLPADLHGTTQSIHAAVNFSSEGRWTVADIALSGALGMTCQRCLQALELTVDSRTRVALVESEEQSREVPEEFETALAPEGQTTVMALVAEELLLSLPIVPLHETPCAPAVLTAVEVEPEVATVRPFKDLRALLKGE